MTVSRTTSVISRASLLSGIATLSSILSGIATRSKVNDVVLSSCIGVDFDSSLKCVERPGRINNGGAGIDGDRHAQHLSDLFPRCSPFPGGRGMHRAGPRGSE